MMTLPIGHSWPLKEYRKLVKETDWGSEKLIKLAQIAVKLLDFVSGAMNLVHVTSRVSPQLYTLIAVLISKYVCI
jgi:hypothetical protein